MTFFKYWRMKLNQRKTFFQMFIYFIIVCLFLLTVSTFYLYTVASKSIIKEIGSHAEDSLQKTANSASYMIDWSLLSAQQWSRDSKLVAYAYSQKSDPYNDYVVWSTLRQIVNNNPLIESIYLINGYTNTVVDSRSGIYTSEEFYDQHALELLTPEQIILHETLIPRTVDGLLNNIKPFQSNVLTFVFPYEPFQSTSTLMINLDESSIVELIGRNLSKIDSTYMLIDDHNQIVASIESELFLQDFPYNDSQFEFEPNQKSGWAELKLEKNDILLSYANLSVIGHDNWKIVYTVPVQHIIESVTHLQNVTLLFYIPLVFITLILVWFMVRKLYVPISRLLKVINIDKFWKNEETYDNELSAASKLYLEQQSNLDKLSHTWRQYRNDARSHLLHDLIVNVQHEGPNVLQQKMNEVNVQVPLHNIQLILIEIDYYKDWSTRYMEHETKLLIYAMMNIVEEKFESHQGHAVELEHYRIGLIISYSDQKTHILELLQSCQNAIEHYLSIQVSITVSRDLSSIYDLVASHSMLQLFIEQKFFVGPGCIRFEEVDTEAETNFSYHYPEDLERKLLNSLNLGHIQETTHYVHNFFQTLKISSVSEAQLSITRLTLTLGKTLEVNYPEMKLWTIRYIQDKILDLETMENYQQWLNEQLTKYIDQQKLLALRPNRNKQLVEQIKQLIEQYHTDQNLSPKWIADQLQLSTNYLRSLYKEESGQSLADVITGKRLEKIAQLLIHTNRTVEDISMSNGFSAVNSFYVSFKRIYGMTPVQYRKQYQREGSSS